MVRLGHVVAAVIAKSILASIHGLLILTDVAPLSGCGVSRLTVALNSVVLIQVGGAITLAGAVSRCCRGGSSYTYVLAHGGGNKDSSKEREEDGVNGGHLEMVAVLDLRGGGR